MQPAQQLQQQQQRRARQGKEEQRRAQQHEQRQLPSLSLPPHQPHEKEQGQQQKPKRRARRVPEAIIREIPTAYEVKWRGSDETAVVPISRVHSESTFAEVLKGYRSAASRRHAFATVQWDDIGQPTRSYAVDSTTGTADAIAAAERHRRSDDSQLEFHRSCLKWQGKLEQQLAEMTDQPERIKSFVRVGEITSTTHRAFTTERKAYGAFAAKDIPASTVLGVYGGRKAVGKQLYENDSHDNYTFSMQTIP